jgi:redox-sensitive bicupin YhaK (pirin superfamily)
MEMLRKSQDRGGADHGWLKAKHSFSFASYYDPKHMGFRSLRVINEDRIAGGRGFGAHPHSDMEIITFIVKGALEHRDSMGNKAVIRPGEIQHMSAGTGVVHSEYNPNPDEETHLLQIWIETAEEGATPGYGQKSFEAQLSEKNLVLVVSQDGRDGSIPIRQDADIRLGRFKTGDSVELPVRAGRGVWVQLVSGELSVNGHTLKAGDGLALEQVPGVAILAKSPAEFLMFDLA